MNPTGKAPGPDDLPYGVAAVLRLLVPGAEQDEVLADFADEYARRAERQGRVAASAWVWGQVLGSLPSFIRRVWWRGMTGFEPRANRARPGGPMLESWIIDARFAMRRLIRRPIYAVLAILTVALGAGGTAAVFSVARALLLDRLPIADEARVAVFWNQGDWSEREFLFLRPDFPGFRTVAAWRDADATLDVPGAPLRFVRGVAASGDMFDVLGARPMMGRVFEPADDRQGAEPTVILSHALWRQLGADPQAVGSRLNLGGAPRTVVGVMPPSFWFPAPTTEFWMAANLNPTNGSGRYALIGRLQDGQNFDGLAAPLQQIAARLKSQFTYSQQWDKTRSPSVVSAHEYFVGDLRPSLVATLAAMALILLIACANVAALMLGQVDAQATDTALRLALGASRRRLVQQFAFESLVIGVLAGAAGAALAAMGFDLLIEALPLGALAARAELDWTVFGASLATALGAAVLIALVAAAAVWRSSSVRGTMGSGRGSDGTRRGGRLESALVVVEMALAVLLTAGAGLLLQSVANLHAIKPGLDPSNVAIVDVTMRGGLPAAERRQAVVDTVQALAALPGATSAAATQKIPLRGSGDNWGIKIDGKPNLPSTTTAIRFVTHDYFSTMGIEVQNGRVFDASDRDTTDRVVVINQALADTYFSGEDPIGRVIQTGFPGGERIVGVVDNALESSLTKGVEPARYMLYDQMPLAVGQLSFLIRSRNGNELPALVDSAQAVLRDGRHFAVQQATTMDAVFEQAIGPAGQVVRLVALLASLAVVLGAVGVYGVISHYVTRRSRDYAIRIVLGQGTGSVARQIVGRGAALVAAGGAIGTVIALASMQVLTSLLYNVEPADPRALAQAVALLVGVGIIASAIPAWRTSVANPAAVLRQQ